MPGVPPQTDQFVGIKTIAITGLNSQSGGDGPSDMTVVGSSGSSAGGNPWTWGFEGGKTGIDWTNLVGQRVDPTTWEWTNPGGGNTSDSYWIINEGDTSVTNPYFQLVSQWGPGECTAELVSYGYTPAPTSELFDLLASGTVYGPVVVPEPATCLILGLGGLSLVVNRRKRG